MIEIVDNKWRPFILLHTGDFKWEDADGNELEDPIITPREYYFDITAKCQLEEVVDKHGAGTYIHFNDGHWQDVLETPKEIIEAVDRLITEEQDKKAAEAHKYFEETQARVAATAAKLEGDK